MRRYNPHILMLIKTTEGAGWALLLAKKLVEADVALSVVLPDTKGPLYKDWLDIAEECFTINLNIRSRNGIMLHKRARELREVIDKVDPDIVHSFFVETTLVGRLAMRGDRRPLIFHVPGPLHIENRLTRLLDIRSARENDYWIASSTAIERLYEKAGVDQGRVFLSHFGVDLEKFKEGLDANGHDIRRIYGIPDDDVMLINVSFFYPPKWYLGHTKGIKNHEGLIKGFAKALSLKDNITLVLVGKEWGEGNRYERRLRNIADRNGGGKVIFAGYLPHEDAVQLIRAANLNIHVPFSENCGGISEAALLRVPSIIVDAGGLGDIIDSEAAGYIAASHKPGDIAQKILQAVTDKDGWAEKAERAYNTASRLFDIKETSRKVIEIYQELLKDN